MTTLATWPELLEAVQPFLTAASPLQAMNEAGFVFADDLSKSLEHQRLVPTIDPGLLQQLQREYGPPPPLRLYVGARSRQADGRRRSLSARAAALQFPAQLGHMPAQASIRAVAASGRGMDYPPGSGLG
jgi:hypothetical protein